MFFLLH